MHFIIKTTKPIPDNNYKIITMYLLQYAVLLLLMTVGNIWFPKLENYGATLKPTLKKL